MMEIEFQFEEEDVNGVYTEAELALFLQDKGWETGMIATFLNDLDDYWSRRDAEYFFLNCIKNQETKPIPYED